MDKLGYKLMLFDAYGGLLTDKQQQALALTYNEDYSLGEIAELLGISRQAVFDNLRRAEALLENYEAKLGLIARNAAEQRLLGELAQAEQNASWQQVAAVRQQLLQLIAPDKEEN
ncbi:MAG: YlxM family DNA-binding protein [Peptococcaceae bacterium]|jgi:predicted DNA-binding protein YlxM (UPF0122 family)|nr:YlxM family DNA-binding protein [Peptococcaceae bacterium]